MLDSTVAMMQILLVAALLLFQDASVAITSPQSGATLRGQVSVAGNMNVPDFSYAELAFAYASDPASTWFLIQSFSQHPTDSTIAAWDTLSLTDGDYNLRLRVYLLDGSFQDAIVTDLKIRNDIPIPADTPTPKQNDVPAPPPPTATSQPASVLPSFPTPTPLPANPASLTLPSVYSSFGRGALTALGSFFLIGILLRLRRS